MGGGGAVAVGTGDVDLSFCLFRAYLFMVALDDTGKLCKMIYLNLNKEKEELS